MVHSCNLVSVCVLAFSIPAYLQQELNRKKVVHTLERWTVLLRQTQKHVGKTNNQLS